MRENISERTFLLLFPPRFCKMAERLKQKKAKLYEIRVRTNAPLCAYTEKGFFYLSEQGEYTRSVNDALYLVPEDVEQWLQHLCRHSLYAYKEEVAQGYITVEGGHRIGIVGQVVTGKQGIEDMKYISSMNIRISHEAIGCAEALLPFLYQNGKVCSTLIVSPPMCGKTTLLRDLIRCVSNGIYDGCPHKIGVTDERGELAASYMGCAGNDLGFHTDVLTNTGKSDGIIRLLRSMSPEVIAMDELGKGEDMAAIKKAFAYGCSIFATVHGKNPEQIFKHPEWRDFLVCCDFERLVGIEHENNFMSTVYRCDSEGLYLMSGQEVKR